MATGASTADLAIILVDARKGILTQTKRHAFISSLLGIKNIILAVNKLDLINYDEDVFVSICNSFKKFSKSLKIDKINFVPISGLNGDNVVSKSKNMAWYKGDTLINILDNFVINENNISPLRLSIQYVIRPNQDFRGYAGSINSGVLKQGQVIKILPSGMLSKINTIYDFENKIKFRVKNQAITFTLDDELDISRGDLVLTKKIHQRYQINFELI